MWCLYDTIYIENLAHLTNLQKKHILGNLHTKNLEIILQNRHLDKENESPSFQYWRLISLSPLWVKNAPNGRIK